MSKKFYGQIILAFFLALAIAGCKGKKSEDKGTTTDTTDKTKTETVSPAPAETTPDAIAAAPGLYKTVADSLGIRVLEVTYKPGDSSVLHSHPDYAVYALADATGTFIAKDGTRMPNNLKKGIAMVRPGEVHSVVNNGKMPLKVMLFEVKRPSTMTPMDAAMDASKVAPNLYKVLADSMGIRVVEINYKPGESSKMHSHPDVALYVINGGTGEFTSKDGTKQTRMLPAGMTAIIPAETHSVKNTGKTTLKAIMVEVSRPRQ